MLERLLMTILILGLAAGTYAVFSRGRRRAAGRVVAAKGRPALLYFQSQHCAPCVLQGRFVQEVEERFGKRVYFEKIDAEVEPERAAALGVFTLPTTVVVDAAGLVRHMNYGLADSHKLSGQLETVI